MRLKFSRSIISSSGTSASWSSKTRSTSVFWFKLMKFFLKRLSLEQSTRLEAATRTKPSKTFSSWPVSFYSSGATVGIRHLYRATAKKLFSVRLIHSWELFAGLSLISIRRKAVIQASYSANVGAHNILIPPSVKWSVNGDTSLFGNWIS